MEQWEERFYRQWMVLAEPHVGVEGSPRALRDDRSQTKVSILVVEFLAAADLRSERLRVLVRWVFPSAV